MNQRSNGTSSAFASGAAIEPYSEGFAAVFASPRYAVYSRRLARLAVSLLGGADAPGRELLDLACGAGAGSVELAAAGFRVSGVDRSDVLLRRAAQNAAAAGVALRLYRQEMQEVRLPYQVDAVTCLFDSLNYLLDEDALRRTFASVAGLLREGGAFVFDMNTPRGLAERWGSGSRVSTLRPDVVELNQYRFQSEQQLNTVTTTVFVRAGEDDLFRRHTEVHRERGYPIETIKRLLADTGFAVAAAYGLAEQFEGLAAGLQPYTDEFGRIMVLARRVI